MRDVRNITRFAQFTKATNAPPVFTETTSIFEMTKSKNSVTTTSERTNDEKHKENSEDADKSKVGKADLDRFIFLSFVSYFLLNTLC